jgi:hypothetical protein
MNTFIIAVVFSIIAVGGVYYFALRMSKGTARDMNLRVKEMAAALGLPEPKPNTSALSAFYSAELGGKIEGRDFYFTNYTRSEKTSDSYNTEFRWKISKIVSNSISISKEGIKSTLKKQFGGNDIEIGHKEFDETFLVRGDNAELAKSILIEPISFDLLKKERGIFGTITIQQDEVRYEESGVLLSVEDLQRMLRLIELCKNIAKQIESI